MKRRTEWNGTVAYNRGVPASAAGATVSTNFTFIPEPFLQEYASPRTVVRIIGQLRAYLEKDDANDRSFAGAWGLVKTTSNLPVSSSPNPTIDVSKFSWMHWRPVMLDRFANETLTDEVSYRTFYFDITQKRKFLEGEELRFCFASEKVLATSAIAFDLNARYLMEF